MNILIKDDYFDNPDHIRKLALSDSTYRVNNDLYGPSGGWKGKRTIPYRLENTICSCCGEKITFDSEVKKYISKQSKIIFDICDEYYQFSKKYPDKTFSITSYFHITTSKTKSSLSDFLQDRFHKDPHGLISGVVYLTPDAPLNAGTSILNGEENQFVNVENKYNRFVAYEGFRIHGVSDCFGDSDETGRLTFTFFIHDILHTAYID